MANWRRPIHVEDAPQGPSVSANLTSQVWLRSAALACAGGCVIGAAVGLTVLAGSASNDDSSGDIVAGAVMGAIVGAIVGLALGMLLGAVGGLLLAIVAVRMLVPYRGRARSVVIMRVAASAVVVAYLTVLAQGGWSDPWTAVIIGVATLAAWLVAPLTVNWYIAEHEAPTAPRQ